MTEETFTELVNLYLDKEISQRGLEDLKAELASNPQRRAEFAERCRLHQAMRLALNPEAAKREVASSTSAVRAVRSSRSGRRTSERRSSSGRSASGSRSSRRSQPVRSSALSPSGATRVDERTQHADKAGLPRWVLGTGLAASLALGLTLLIPVFRDTTSLASQPALEGVDADELVETDPLDEIGRSELMRFASVQAQRAANERASIAAQLRLMGLHPELTPREKQLRDVSMAATRPRAPQRNHAELLVEMQKMTPMPSPKILHEETYHSDPSVHWPGGFQASLASFK